VIVAVLADGDGAHDKIVQALRAQNPRSIERAEGQWREGEWADFDPVRPMELIEGR
jgi:hypothetical protein